MENRLESIQSQIENEENDLKSRIENRLKWLQARDAEIKQIHYYIFNSQEDSEYDSRKDELFLVDEYLYCALPLTEIYYHYLEVYHPSLYRNQLIEVGKKHGKQATLENAFNCLRKQPQTRRTLILSIVDNGIALNHCVTNDDYDSFCQKILDSRTGSYEVLCICDFLMEGDLVLQVAADQLIFLMNTVKTVAEIQTNFMISNSEKDRQLSRVAENVKEEVEKLAKLDNYLKLKYVQSSRNVTNYQEAIDGCIDIMIHNEYTVDSLLDNLSDSFHDLFSAIHFESMVSLFYTEFGKVANLSYRYLQCLDKKGYSIKDEVINHCKSSHTSLLDEIVNQSGDPKNSLLLDAKMFLEKKKEADNSQPEKSPHPQKTKGRPKGIWLNIDTKYTEEDIGRMLKAEIWHTLKDRISEFELLEPRSGKKIEGNRRDIIIDALGCCFIFYSAFTLGYANNLDYADNRNGLSIRSSFIRTTKVLSTVSKNTIFKYWWVINEAEEWENRQSGYKRAFRESKRDLTLILEKNLKTIIDTIDFVKINLEDFWERLKS